MPLYFFNVRNGCGNLFDDEGADFPDVEAARQYAREVARDLMGGVGARRRHWWIMVRDADGNELFALPFVAVDDSIQRLNATSKQLIESMCRKRLALAEMVFETRMGILRARATVARSKSRPYLVADHGRAVFDKHQRTA